MSLIARLFMKTPVKTMTSNSLIEQFRATVRTHAETLDQGKIALLETSRDLQAIVDKKLVNQIDRYRWYAVISGGNHVYAVADIDGSRIAMQRFVLALATEQDPKDVKHVTFRNKLTLDCRLENLVSKADRQAVMMNRKPKRNTSSKFKGVIKHQQKDGGVVWRTQIKGPDGSMSVGTYHDEETAARAYDAAAALLFREAGFRNFPEEPLDSDLLENARARIARFAIIKARKARKAQSPD